MERKASRRRRSVNVRVWRLSYLRGCNEYRGIHVCFIKLLLSSQFCYQYHCTQALHMNDTEEPACKVHGFVAKKFT